MSSLCSFSTHRRPKGKGWNVKRVIALGSWTFLGAPLLAFVVFSFAVVVVFVVVVVVVVVIAVAIFTKAMCNECVST